MWRQACQVGSGGLSSLLGGSGDCGVGGGRQGVHFQWRTLWGCGGWCRRRRLRDQGPDRPPALRSRRLNRNLALPCSQPADSKINMKKLRQACILTAIFLSNSEAQEVWTHRYSPSQSESGNRRFVAVGRPGLYLAGSGVYATNDDTLSKFLRSTNGINWSTVELPNAWYMAVTETGFIGVSGNGIWTTDAAQTFQTAYSPSGSFWPMGIAAGAGCWVVVSSDGKILRATSPSGPWIPQLSPTNSIEGVAFGNEIFMASTSGAQLISSDGIAWTIKPNPESKFVQGFGNGLFFLPGWFSSDSGISWKEFLLPDAIYPAALATDSAKFVACIWSKIYTSPDLRTWTERASGIADNLRAVSFCGDLWVAVSSAGLITTSPVVGAAPLTAPPLTIGPAVELKWPSITGRSYQIQGSANNATWADVGMPMLGNGSELRFTAPATDGRKFFRVEVR